MTKTIVHMISNRWNSAITEYAISTARAMQLLKYRNVFVCLKERPAGKRARDLGFEVVEIDEFSVQQWSTFAKVADDFNPNAVIAYGGTEMILAWPMQKEGRKIIRVRGNLFHPKLFNRSFYRIAHRHVDLVVAPSQHVKMKIPKRPEVTVVTIGIDEKIFKRVSSGKSERPELLVFGRLDPIKGHANFIRLFADLLVHWNESKCPKPRLKIAGKEENTKVAELEAAAHQCGLIVGEDIVFETGFIEDRAALLSSATIGVVCSLGSELICRVAQEFLMCGTPVAVSRVGSLPEVIAEPSFGVTFDHKAPNILHLEDFIVQSFRANEEERKTISNVAHKHFSLGEMARKLIDIV